MTKTSRKSAGKRGSKANIHQESSKSKNGESKKNIGDGSLEDRDVIKIDEELELENNGEGDVTSLASKSKVSLDDENKSQSYKEPANPLASIIVQHYEGQRGSNGEYEGYGMATFIDGNTYEGFFSNGKMNGQGKYKWTSGIKYEGDFSYNQISGYGRYEWSDNSFYEGEILDGIRHGVGVFKSIKYNMSYSGQWMNGKRHGKAIMHYSEHSWYKGDWINNVRHGWGVRRYASGNVYEGQWMNDKRHGEGTMRWLTSNESYTGMWKEGVQHGCGTHTWYLHRVPGSQYLLRNEYVGQFDMGLRHGNGKFFFASGAMYSGEWDCNKKHGWGKFIFKNGRVFEGKFKNDHMLEHPEFSNKPDEENSSRDIETRSPIGNDEINAQGQLNMSLFGPGVSLDLGFILKDFDVSNHVEVMQQLSFLLLRNVSVLRRIYSFYSALGHNQSADNTFAMTRFQFWRFLKDCQIHHFEHSLIEVDRLLAKNMASLDDIHNPMQKILLREFLNSIVVLSYTIFKERTDNDESKEGKMTDLSRCFMRILNDHILKYSCKVGGHLLFDPDHAIIGLSYMDKCWEIYHVACEPRNKPPFDLHLTVRHLLFLLKDFKMIGRGQLTAADVFRSLSYNDPKVVIGGAYNVNMEITFLEFFEALVGCALCYTEPACEEEINENNEMFHAAAADHLTESLVSDHRGDQEESIMSTSQQLGSNFDAGGGSMTAAPRGGTGEFLQALSQMTLNDELSAEEVQLKADEPTGSEKNGEKTDNSQQADEEDPVKKRQRELDEWGKKLEVFFANNLFPRWQHHMQMKDEVIRYREIEAEERRIKALHDRQEYMSLASFHGNLNEQAVAPCMQGRRAKQVFEEREAAERMASQTELLQQQQEEATSVAAEETKEDRKDDKKSDKKGKNSAGKKKGKK